MLGIGMRSARAAALVVGLGLLFLLTAGAVAAEPLSDVANGKTLWEKSTCAKCHGVKGEGLTAGPRAGDGRTLQQWITQVRTPRANMPSYTAAQVSDKDLADMHEYMQTLPAVTGFTAARVVAGPSDPPGKTLLAQKRCSSCHGENGPVAAFKNTNRVPTAQAVISQLRKPKANMPMFSERQVTDAEAAQIAEFLASQLSVAAALPKSGEPTPLLTFAIFGAALAAGGLALRRFAD